MEKLLYSCKLKRVKGRVCTIGNVSDIYFSELLVNQQKPRGTRDQPLFHEVSIPHEKVTDAEKLMNIAGHALQRCSDSRRCPAAGDRPCSWTEP